MAKPEKSRIKRSMLWPSRRFVGASRRAYLAALLALLLLVTSPASAWAQQGVKVALAPEDRSTAKSQPVQKGEKPDGSGDAEEASGSEGSEPSGDGGAEPEKQLTGRPFEVKPPGFVYGNTRLTGQFMVAFRGVSVGGDEDIYRKDIDLDDGVRIKGTNLVATPADRSAERWYDRASLVLDGVGGDPYETIAFDINKIGAYKLDITDRRVDYFFVDHFNHHAWQEERRMTDVNLSVTPVDGLQVFADYGRWSKDGIRETTRDISRNEFVWDEDLDQIASKLAGGFRYTARGTGTTFFFTQELNQYKFNVPAQTFDNPGLIPDEAVVSFLRQQEVRAMDAPISTGGVSQTFLDGRGQVYADFMYSKQSLAFTFNRLWDGLNYERRPVAVNEDAMGDATRKVKHGNLTASGAVHKMLTVYGKYRRRQWDQTAEQTSQEVQNFADDDVVIGTGFFEPAYNITMDQFAFGADLHGMAAFQGVRRFNVFGEIGYLKQGNAFAEEPGDVHEVDTSGTTFKIGGTARGSHWDIKGTYDRGDLDDPFTRITPTVVNKFRIRGRGRYGQNLSTSAHFTYRSSKNPETGCCPQGADADYKFDSRTVGFSANYTLLDRGWVMAAYNYTSLDSSTPIFYRPFFAGSAEGIARYENRQHLITVSGDYRVSDTVPFAVYGLLSLVNTSGVSGDDVNGRFGAIDTGIKYYDFRLGGRFTHASGFLIDGEVRFLDFEDDFLLNQALAGAYDATMFSIGVGWVFQ